MSGGPMNGGGMSSAEFELAADARTERRLVGKGLLSALVVVAVVWVRQRYLV